MNLNLIVFHGTTARARVGWNEGILDLDVSRDSGHSEMRMRMRMLKCDQIRRTTENHGDCYECCECECECECEMEQTSNVCGSLAQQDWERTMVTEGSRYVLSHVI